MKSACFIKSLAWAVRILLVFWVAVLHAEEPASQDKLKFAIFQFEVKGNTLLEQVDIERTLYPFMGTGKRIEDVESARSALEQFYREKGYPTVIVNIPEQNASLGTITFDVTESRISNVIISGSDYFSPKDVREKVPALREGAIFSMPAVREQLGKLNMANPDRMITPVLRAGKFPGTVEVELKVKDKLPAHVKLELNNRYSAYTTHQRANLSLNYGNLWQQNHSIGLDYQWSPQDTSEVKVLVAKYLMPIGGETDKLVFYFVDSKSKVRPAAVPSVLGTGNIYGVRWVHPLQPLDRFYHNFSLGYDFKDFKDVIDPSGLNSETPIDYSSFSMSYSGSHFGELDEEAQIANYETDFSASMNFGVRGLGNEVSEFRDKASFSRADFLYTKFSLEHTHLLPWQLSAYGKAEVQLSDQVLISNEQYSIGGADTVRGYLESSASGDVGEFATLELRSMPFVKDKTWQLNTGYAFIFSDYGKVRLNTSDRVISADPNAGQRAEIMLGSYGLGFRMTWFDALKLDAIAAQVTKTADPEQTVDAVKKGDKHVHFSVSYEF